MTGKDTTVETTTVGVLLPIVKEAFLTCCLLDEDAFFGARVVS